MADRSGGTEMSADDTETYTRRLHAYIIFNLRSRGNDVRVVKRKPKNITPLDLVIEIDLEVEVPKPATKKISGKVTLSPLRKVDIVSSILSEYDEKLEGGE